MPQLETSRVLLRVPGMVLFDLLLLFHGVWASVSPATCGEGSWLCCQRSFEPVKLQGQKGNLGGLFCDGRAGSPKGQSWWAVLSLAEMLLEFAAGREAGEGDVVT